MNTITISKDFKQKATTAVLSIVLFIIVYITLITVTLAATVGFGYAGLALIAASPSLFTVIVGLGIMSIGVILLIFVFKFIFTKNQSDVSGFIEIYEENEPELFAFIRDIVEEVQTDFPKKIFVSSQVNASVFYDSGFWSMFLPVKKNLHIGLGLMNTTTVNEFKGILAHEFGHFSQKSMKIGSYVYNVNYVLHNMLYDNESYNNLVGRWASVHGYFSFFALISIKITNAIQWLLRRVYNYVNINYLALSREMEFHADEVAVNLAGSGAIKTSLLRAELASYSLNRVFEIYSDLINENIKPKNIFTMQGFAMNYLAGINKISVVNGLPEVDINEKNRFDKSQIDFGNQWASHPGDEERIERAARLNIIKPEVNNHNACMLLADKEAFQQRVTSYVFSEIEYPGIPQYHELADFEAKFTEIADKSGFPLKYNSYYDNSADILVNTDITAGSTIHDEEVLFSQENVDRIYNYISLKYDLETIKSIENGEIKVKSFNYNGQRYTPKQTTGLISNIEQQLPVLQHEIENHNQVIFGFYKSHALRNGTYDDYLSRYKLYSGFIGKLDEIQALIEDIRTSTSFFQEQTPYEIIYKKTDALRVKEDKFKKAIKALLSYPGAGDVITGENAEILNKYNTGSQVYFSNTIYNEEAINLLYQTISVYTVAVNGLLFKLKKDFLDFQSQLVKTSVSNAVIA